MSRWRSLRHSPSLAVALLALFVALGGPSYAVNGAALVLGERNTASSPTSLVAKIDGRALVLTNTSEAPGATALDLKVAEGHPPLRVSSDTKVRKLNADLLDGLDADGFVQGASAAECCFGEAKGKSYFNRVETASDGAKSTFLVLPGLLHLQGSCFQSVSGTFAFFELTPEIDDLDAFYFDSDSGISAHLPGLDTNATFQLFTEATRFVTLQAGLGQNTQGGQELATLTVFFTKLSNGNCFFQVSALHQTT